MAILWTFALKATQVLTPGVFGESLALMARAGMVINAALMVLNLFPLPPLDGGRIAVSLLPRRFAYRFAKIEPFGMIILVVLMFLGVLNFVLLPFVNTFIAMLAAVFHL